MTINGTATMMLAFFLNTAIDQQVEKKQKKLNKELNESELAEVKKSTLEQVRGTVQEKRYGIHRLTESFLRTEIIDWKGL